MVTPMNKLQADYDALLVATRKQMKLQDERDELLAALKDVISSWETELREPWAVGPKVEGVHAVMRARELIARVEAG